MRYLGKCIEGYKFGNKNFSIVVSIQLPYYEAIEEANRYFYGGGIPSALISPPLGVTK